MKSIASLSSPLLLAFAAAPCFAQARFERVTVSTSGAEANGNMGGGKVVLSADGRHVAFDSYASNLAPYDINNTIDVFVRDRQLGTTTLVSVALTGLSGNNFSFLDSMSPDGRFIVFTSGAYDLVKFDTNQQGDIFLHDRDPDGNGVFDEGNATIVRASLGNTGVEANAYSSGAGVTADGGTVVFRSDASNLVTGDSNGVSDIFVRDLAAGTTTRVSVSTTGKQSNGYSNECAISRDGTVVMFSSYASNLIASDTNGRQDVFVRDLVAGTTGRVSNGNGGVESDSDALSFSMSDDGQRVVFWSHATNLVSGDTNNAPDVFLRDRTAGTTTRLSVSEAGVQGNGSSSQGQLSPNGAFVVFSSSADNLAGIETNRNGQDVFVRDLVAGTIRKVSVHPSGKEGDSSSNCYAISDDGLFVAMLESAFDLIGGDANGIYDLLIRDRTLPDPQASWQNYGAGWPGTLGVPSFTALANPVLGTTVEAFVGNSVGFYTVGFLYLGLQQISVPTRLDGTQLVDPLATIVFLVEPFGTTLDGDLPLDDALVGTSFFAQVLQLDNGASKGVSFTEGLELLLGQ
ncbi:MAG: hypothetical protein JNL90_14270 [Planctomycetes bacterium]|nr:hypothetical protein [Planctomycetota bacterium]